MYISCGRELAIAYVRSIKIDATRGSRALLKLLMQRIRQAWPLIAIRVDSG
jgi:hypothetical protein